MNRAQLIYKKDNADIVMFLDYDIVQAEERNDNSQDNWTMHYILQYKKNPRSRKICLERRMLKYPYQ